MSEREISLRGVEEDAFSAYKEVLLSVIPEKFVVIKGREIIGIEDSFSEAVDEGHRLLGYGVPFLAKQVLEKDRVYIVRRAKI